MVQGWMIIEMIPVLRLVKMAPSNWQTIDPVEVKAMGRDFHESHT